jgi:hypothetical protein
MARRERRYSGRVRTVARNEWVAQTGVVAIVSIKRRVRLCHFTSANNRPRARTLDYLLGNIA